MKLFDRQARVAVGSAGGTGFEVGAAAGDGIPLHIKFSIEKADVESPNTGKVCIWNLNDGHLAELEAEDCTVIVRAGYGNNLSVAFSGTATHVVTSKEGADRMTEIEVADGMVELRDTGMSVSYAEGTSTETIYREVAERMGMPLGSSPGAAGRATVLGNGFSFVGSAKNLLKRLARMDGTGWSIQDGTLQVTGPGEPVSLSCYELNAGSGLTGVPKRVNGSASSGSAAGTGTGKEGTRLGWEITYLMNLNIGVNSLVHLTSKAVTGYFRVQKVSVEGDNYEGDWQCRAVLLEVEGS